MQAVELHVEVNYDPLFLLLTVLTALNVFTVVFCEDISRSCLRMIYVS